MDRYDSQTTATWVTLIMNRPHGTWEDYALDDKRWPPRPRARRSHSSTRAKDRGCAEVNPAPAAPPKKQRSACPADSSAFRLHHIRGRGHGSFLPVATGDILTARRRFRGVCGRERRELSPESHAQTQARPRRLASVPFAP